jgi:hypothetical protein
MYGDANLGFLEGEVVDNMVPEGPVASNEKHIVVLVNINIITNKS